MYKYVVQIPPIRTSLTEVDLKGAALSGNAPQPTDTTATAGAGNGVQPPRTSKEWYHFWRQSGAQINANSNLVTSGTHADRPDPANTPDGALYCETDRGGVLYQLRNGLWWYVAGTMYGTLSPDQRPTDLGVTDGGFEFRSTDVVPPYEDRQFIWSQTQWVETTAVHYGTHAERLAVVIGNVIDGLLWVETDRGQVLYQLQNGAWWFATGTMYGTLSPDQRPTDLGTHDGGFIYRTTDTAPSLADREFIWSQTAWIEVTSVRYGTHAQRLAVVPAGVVDGLIWVETDRGDVSYQLQGGTWRFLSGTIFGTLSPDQRPTDLGATDAGFDYRTTDTAPANAKREFVWSGSAWVEVTQPGLSFFAAASGTLTLTASYQAVPGCSVTLSRAGTWLISMTFDFQSTNDSGAFLLGGISQTSLTAVFEVQSAAGTQGRATVFQQVVLTASAGTVIQMQAVKVGGAGTSSVQANSTLVALWVSP